MIQLITYFLVLFPLFQQDTVQLRFEDFPIKVAFHGLPKGVDFTGSSDAKLYRTVLRNGAKKGPNFADHFTIVIWGCGTSTQAFAIIDALSGKVYFCSELPFVSYADWHENDYGLHFRKDSNLLIANGHIKEDDPKGRFYFLWKVNKLKLIKSISVK